MRKARKGRIIGYILLLILVIIIIYSLSISYKKNYTGLGPSFSQLQNIENIKGSYKDYLKTYNNKNKPNKDIPININDPIYKSENSFFKLDNGIITSDDAIVKWEFNVPISGLYQIEIIYQQVILEEINGIIFRGKSGEAERVLKINNEIPFTEAKQIRFSRIWEDKFSYGKSFSLNNNGDEIRPKQVEKPKDIKELITDYEVRDAEPYYFYFNEGSNTITLESIREPLIIKGLTLKNKREIPEYEDKLNEWKKEGLEVIKGEMITNEAEYMYEKNTPVLIPLLDKSSSMANPYYDGSKIRLNCIGVYSWRLPGYWLSYKVIAPKTALYALSIKGKQDVKSGTSVFRQIIINDEIPFKEASYLKLRQSGTLDNYYVGNKDKPYLFKLNEGENIIKFKISLANISNVLSYSKELMKNLNTLYLRIIEYTSATPDLDRDYNIEDQKEIVKLIKENFNLVSSTISIYKKTISDKSGRLSVLNNLKRQLTNFNKDPERVIYELNSLESNISALGTWLLEEQEQPFTMDSFTFYDPQMKIKRARANIFELSWFEYVKFIASFSSNRRYQSGKGSRKIKVWIISGRDNAQILRRIIDDEFKSGIQVDLELVPVEALLRATVSGKGPDVALSIPEGTPIDFAFRGAAYDLSNFKDNGLDEVLDRFYESAITPFRYKGGLYALPEQQVFPVFFYRKDIFNRLNLEIPQTREELYHAIEIINSNNFNFYVDSGAQTMKDYLQMTGLSNSINAGFFPSILYQYDGSFYKDDDKKCSLSGKKEMQAFTDFTDFFTVYKVPVQADFANRFRSGEIAAGIIDYQNYNTLSVFAPEISGNWGIKRVPQIGNKDVVASKSIASSMILANAKDKLASWEFLSWWLDTPTQVLYAQEMETIMGAAARYTTANYRALRMLSWPSKDLEVISSQQKRTRGMPQVPGGYMTTREFNYAFHAVIRGEPAYEVMYEHSRKIDKELIKKQKEIVVSD